MSVLSQAAVHEGLSHQAPERDLLLEDLGSGATEKLQKSASDALSERLETASTSAVSCQSFTITVMMTKQLFKCFCSIHQVPDLSSLDETMDVHPSASTPLSETNKKESFEKNDQIKAREAVEKTEEDMTEPLHKDTATNQDSALVTVDAKHLAAHSEASEEVQEDQKPFRDFGVTPKKVFTIMLDIERPEFLPQAKQWRDAGASVRPDPITCLQREVSSSTLIGPESDETDLKIPCLQSLASNEPPVAESLPGRALASASTESEEEERATSAKVSEALSEEAEAANHLEHTGSRPTEEAGRGESEPKQVDAVLKSHSSSLCITSCKR